jgi:murein DD-endopeptidase MepM/ murein hydrolase activator NlpD
MNIILLSRRHGRVRQVDLKSPATLGLVVIALVLVVGGVFAAGSVFGALWAKGRPANELQAWASQIASERREVDAARATLQQNIDVLAQRVGQMNAHVVRLDALGKRLTQMANLQKGEFNFDSAPPVGGSASEAGKPAAMPVLTDMLDHLSSQLDDREHQLGALENLILNRELSNTVYPQGRPVQSGFISSFYGERVDPFTGYTAFHSGVDFAGEEGSHVTAVAAGVVTWAGDYVGYGSMVEINHGNGYVTRYGHNSAILVKVGDTVQKGQPLSLLGSSGHSTGPHVHFEVLRDGTPIDPMVFINQNAAPLLRASR